MTDGRTTTGKPRLGREILGRIFTGSKKSAKDFSSQDRFFVCLYDFCECEMARNGSLDLAARAIVLQAFVFDKAILDAATEFAEQRQMNRHKGARIMRR
jgi:hypothetical protein